MDVPIFLNDFQAHKEYVAENPEMPCGAYLVICELPIHFGYWTCCNLLEWRKRTFEFGIKHAHLKPFFEHRVTEMCEILRETPLYMSHKSYKAARYFALKLPELLKDYQLLQTKFDREVLECSTDDDKVTQLIAQFVRYAYIGFYVMKFIPKTDFHGFHVQTHSHLKPTTPEEKMWEITSNPRECDKCLQTYAKLQRCSICRMAKYCSKECQRAHWTAHKPICKKWKDTVMQIK